MAGSGARRAKRQSRSRVQLGDMKDLTHPAVMWLKAVLFLAISGTCFTLLMLENPGFRTAVFLLLLIWSSCRAYYFAFYVIERYVDPRFRYAGLWALFRELARNRFTKEKQLGSGPAARP